jgi:hypothetical protein
MFGLSGCGKKKPVIVKGTVVLPDRLKVEKDDQVSLAFTPQDKSLQASGTTISNDDNTFEAKGLDKKGLVPGKYTITVSFVVPPGASGGQARDRVYKDLNKRYDPANSPLSFDVTPETTSITIDLTKDTVTKN